MNLRVKFSYDNSEQFFDEENKNLLNNNKTLLEKYNFAYKIILTKNNESFTLYSND